MLRQQQLFVMIVVEYTCAKFCTQQNEKEKLPIKWSSNSAVCLWEEKSLKTYIKLEKKTHRRCAPCTERMQGNYVIFGEWTHFFSLSRLPSVRLIKTHSIPLTNSSQKSKWKNEFLTIPHAMLTSLKVQEKKSNFKCSWILF